MRFLALVLLALSSAVHAQCTKDTDCKGDRICEKGVCTAPTPSSARSKSLTAPPSAAAATMGKDTDSLGPALEDLLKCTKNPEPAVAMTVLFAHGYIGDKPKLVMDGMEIFAVKKPLVVFGFKVLEVTGFDPMVNKYRGPGTSTPLNFAAVVDGDPEVVTAEVQKRVNKGPTVNKAIYSKYGRPAAEISCFGR